MIHRRYNAPNVEYNEIDRSQYGLINDGAAVGTMTFFTGFADKGDDYDAKYSRSLQDFVNTYGYPTNEAERYFYNAAQEVFSHGGRIVTAKIPYDNDSKDKLAYTVYSSSGVKPMTDSELSVLSSVDPTITSYIELNSVEKEFFQNYLSCVGPVDRTGLMTMEEYDSLLVGSQRPKENSLFIVDTARNRYSKDPNVVDLLSNETDSYLGFVPVIVSPWNAFFFQNLIELSSEVPIDIDELKEDGSENLANVVRKIDEIIREANDLKTLVSFNIVRRFQSIPNTGYVLSDNFGEELDSDDILETALQLVEDIEELKEDGSEDCRHIVSKVNELARYLNYLKKYYFGEDVSEGGILSSTMNNMPPLSTVYSHFAQPLASSETVSETVSKIAASFFPSIRYLTEERLDRTYLKQIGIVVFRMVSDPSNDGLINFVPVESYVGSLDRGAKDLVTGKNLFIDDIVNNSSQTINVFSNFVFHDLATVSYGNQGKDRQVVSTELDKASTIKIADQTVTSLGFFNSQCSKFISEKIIEESLDMILDNCKDPERVPMDIIVDAGTSNVAQYIASNDTVFYDPEFDTEDSYSLNASTISTWKKILKKFDDFARYVRKDCIFVADGPRQFCLVGNQKIIRKSAPRNTIAKNLIPKVKYMSGINSSYSAGYCNWFRCIDSTSQDYFWCPPSIKAAGVYLYTDRYANTWDAPAGDNRGQIQDAYDVAFSPTVEEAQSFYEQQWNYAVSYPINGIVLEGQKTFQVDKTALDRVNVRRLCLAIKKGIKDIARWFKYEKITDYEMARFRDQLNEFLQKVQLNQGISEYYLKLDRENNTDETIERNELHAAIAIRPIKTAEFIIIDSIIVNQSANLEEVMQSVLA